MVTVRHDITAKKGEQALFQIENELRGADIPRTIRFTEPLFEALNEVAQQNHVSFNRLVLQCCKYALEQMEQGEQ